MEAFVSGVKVAKPAGDFYFMHTPLQTVQLSFSNSAPPPGQSNVAAFALAGQCSDKKARIGKFGIKRIGYFDSNNPPQQLHSLTMSHSRAILASTFLPAVA